MRIGSHDLDRRVLIVAEIGMNHEGSCALARDLVDRAAEAGADAVKLQTYRTEEFVARVDRERYERLERFRLPDEALGDLANRAHDRGLQFLSTPLDLASVVVLSPLVDAYKVASSDNTFGPLLEAVAAEGRPVIVSTGLATEAEIETALGIVRAAWSRRGIAPADRGPEIALLHCVTAYPTPDDEVNLAAIATLRTRFGVTAGYSDHTLGIDAAVLAVAAGARIVEKHFTIDKAYSSFRDHRLSADPPELAALVARIRAAESMLGDGLRVPRPCERDHVTALRRSTIFRRDLRIGDAITADDLAWVRPGGGMPASAAAALAGRVLRADVRKGDLVTEGVLLAPSPSPAGAIEVGSADEREAP